MILPEAEIEPVLVELFSDDSVVGDSTSESGIDALWFEVGELLEQSELPLADLDEQIALCAAELSFPTVERKRARSAITANLTTRDALVPKLELGNRKRKDSVASTPSYSKKSKFADEDDVKREIRMARNRASAERTRLKRLEHIKSLEVQAIELDGRNEALSKLLKATFGKSDKEMDMMVPEVIAAVPPLEPPRRARAKKGDAKELLRKLEQEADSLSPDEVAQLRKEARMARNRASAERTRLRRLEAARQLEVRVNVARFRNDKMSSLLKNCAQNLSPEERLRLNVDALLEPIEIHQQHSMDTTSCDSGSTCYSSGDEGDATPCFEHEVARHERLCETRPAGSVLLSRLLYSPLLKLLVTRKASVCNGLVVSKQGGWNFSSFAVRVCGSQVACHVMSVIVGFGSSVSEMVLSLSPKNQRLFCKSTLCHQNLIFAYTLREGL